MLIFRGAEAVSWPFAESYPRAELPISAPTSGEWVVTEALQLTAFSLNEGCVVEIERHEAAAAAAGVVLQVIPNQKNTGEEDVDPCFYVHGSWTFAKQPRNSRILLKISNGGVSGWKLTSSFSYLVGGRRV